MITRKHRGWLPLLIIIFTTLALSACAVPEEDEIPVLVDPTGFVAYVHPTGAFSLSMPQDWVVSDTSDAYALNVAFSPPHVDDPLISVHVVSAAAIGESTSAVDPLQAFENTSGVFTELDSFISIYHATAYAGQGVYYKELARDIQDDGSLRINYVLESAEGAVVYNDFYHLIGSYFVVLTTRVPSAQNELRTLTRIINTLTVEGAAQWSSEIVTNGSVSSDLVEFTSLNHWVDRNGQFIIVGQVRNNAELPIEFVRVNALLYDASRRVLFEQDDFVSSDQIAPGELAPFSVVFADGLPGEVVRYDLEASASYADTKSDVFYGSDNFDLSVDTGFDDTGLLVVSGQVRNRGLETANLVKVIVMIFDSENRIIGLDTTLVDVQKLSPGDISPYSVRFFELGGSPQRYRVIVQGIIAGE